MAKSKEELISMIENDLVDPSTNKITGERVKNALTEMVDAMGTGGGGGGEDRQLVYFEIVDKTQADVLSIIMVASLAKTTNGIFSPQLADLQGLTPSACAIDLSLELMINGMNITIGEQLLAQFPDLQISGTKLISKEEFYAV